MNGSVVVFWVYVVSAVIAALVESHRLVKALAYDERRLQMTPGYTPETTWGNVLWAVLRMLCPVLNTLVAGLELCERVANLIARLDRPILRKRP